METHQNIIETRIVIAFQNEAGLDLLDPATVNFIPKKNISVYFEKNGVSKRAFNRNLDYPHYLQIVNDGRQYLMLLYLDETAVDPVSGKITAYLRYGNRPPDKLVASLDIKKGNKRIAHVLVNNTTIWQNKADQCPLIIVK